MTGGDPVVPARGCTGDEPVVALRGFTGSSEPGTGQTEYGSTMNGFCRLPTMRSRLGEAIQGNKAQTTLINMLVKSLIAVVITNLVFAEGAVVTFYSGMGCTGGTSSRNVYDNSCATGVGGFQSYMITSGGGGGQQVTTYSRDACAGTTYSCVSAGDVGTCHDSFGTNGSGSNAISSDHTGQCRSKDVEFGPLSLEVSLMSLGIDIGDDCATSLESVRRSAKRSQSCPEVMRIQLLIKITFSSFSGPWRISSRSSIEGEQGGLRVASHSFIKCHQVRDMKRCRAKSSACR
nr:hypothetical protein CFP56_11700 [Quercus suber]